MLLVPAVNAASAQAAGPEWKLTVTPDAEYFLPDTPAAHDQNVVYTIEAENVGGQSTSETEQIALEDTLPSGFTATGVQFYASTLGLSVEACTTTPQCVENNRSLSEHGYCPTDLRCEYPGPGSGVVPRGQRLIMLVHVDVPSGTPTGPITDHARISGGGASPAEAAATNQVNPSPAYGIRSFSSALTDSSGAAPYTQAGGHPFQFSTQIDLATVTIPQESNAHWGIKGTVPIHDPQRLTAELPPGLIANPQAVPHCQLADFFGGVCPISTVVGDVGISINTTYQGALPLIVALFNLQPSGAYPGQLGYSVLGVPYVINAGLRSGSDYGVSATSLGITSAGLHRVRVTLWGVPAEHAHDLIRGKQCGQPEIYVEALANSPSEDERLCEHEHADGPFPNGGEAGVPPTPFLTLPTECSGNPLTISASSSPWQVPSEEARATTTLPPVDGCNQLSFEPEIEARPTTNLADAPSGLDFNLKVPQNHAGPEGKEDPEGLATADLKEAVVKLPPGLVVNPSSGAGLEGCSPAQIGLTTPVATTPAHFTEAPAACPDASKLGTVEVKTALLHNPLQGSVYLATPHQNPSGNLLAGYIVLEGEGIIVKLAGQFQADPATGQITASFLENPQTPFEEFKFHFFEGARGALRTPAVCGSYETTAILTPYSAPESGPPAEPGTEFETTAGPTGGACPNGASEEPNKPVFHAGTESPQAGIYSPFSLKLVREDGSQEIKGIDTTLPPGLVGKLAGIAECSDAQLAAAAAPGHTGAAEQASPSCPASSEVGTVDVAAGAGPTPLNVPGHAYLAGPYKSAPLSLAIITPAVAGPFDLGTVVVRTALYVNPETAQIHASSDPIPTILEGIPLDVRSIALKMARPNFTLNPTNCEPLAFSGSALSVLGATAPLAQRFQVGGCPALKFKPGLKLSLKGGTKRHTFPALKAVITYPKKGAYANIASAQVTLPHSAFLEQGHIGTVCTRPQLASHTCPAKSIYGHATAVTPLLDKPLSGPVYLGVGFGHKLPDLVADLNGQIEVLLHGKVDTGKEDGIRNTFEVVPDAPVSKFTLSMFGGKKGLIVNSENLCGPRAKTKALAQFVGQNGKSIKLEPTVANSCKKKGKGKKHGNAKRPSHRLGRSHR